MSSRWAGPGRDASVVADIHALVFPFPQTGVTPQIDFPSFMTGKCGRFRDFWTDRYIVSQCLTQSGRSSDIRVFTAARFA